MAKKTSRASRGGGAKKTRTKAIKKTAKREATPAVRARREKTEATAERGISAIRKAGPEPEGGPSARRDAFLSDRFATLGPKADEDDPQRDAVPAARAAEDAHAASADPHYRQRVVAEYRKRQQTSIEDAPAIAAARASSDATAKTADEQEEDDLLGERPRSGSSPPAPPLAPPANNWIPIGPSVLRKGQGGTQPSTSGRVNGIAIASGGTRVYAAAANGGVWRSDDEGRTWRSLMDAWDLNPTTVSSDSLSCGSIAIDPANPDRIFVGSGDGNEAAIFGVGPVVSTDGGANWIAEPVAAGSPALAGTSMNAIAVDPGNADRVVAGSFNGVYRREPNPAGGFHWARKSGPTGRIKAVVVARSGGATTFYAAPEAGPVFSSSDGDGWAVVGTGFPASGVGRVGLAVRSTDPTVVYALVAASDGSAAGVWRLNAGAGQWRQVTGHPTDLFGTPAIGFQGWYDLAIAVDPNDAGRIYLGGSTKQSAGEWSGAVYRSQVTSSGAGAALTYSMTNTYIGGSVHADIHALAFAPGDSSKLWLGCDGGVFYSTNPTGAGNIFVQRNTGLQVLTMNQVDHHPTEDAVVFAGTQDNGGGRFTGEEAWLHSVWGDCGAFVINWADPYRILATYVGASINRSTDGGTRYNYAPVSIALPVGDAARFYAPLVGTPPSATLAEAERVAFGSRRPWISETFGGGWQSIPNNNNTDDLGSTVRSLRFASFTKLYAGTSAGRVYRFDRSGTAWTRTRLDTMGGAQTLPIAGPVTSMAVDPSDPSRNSIYIAFGGSGDFRHIWRFDGTGWQARSGPAAGAIDSLIDVQHNAVVCDPADPAVVYAGADIGVWRSANGGQNWTTFSAGLPDAAVLDLDLHHARRLLRAGTYGRGIFEYRIDSATVPGVELYVRDTQLDQGRFGTTNGLPDPTVQGATVRHWAGPDIKLDTPDASGTYQFPVTPGTTVDFEQFTNQLSDDFQNVATHATATITTRVYVQVHNRGVTPANNVRVMLLLANASAALPALPFGYAASVQSGTPITTPSWRTVGFATLNDVRVGFPKVAAFNLTSAMLPPPASLAGNNHHCVLALVHHAGDPFTATQTVTDLLSLGERKAAHKNLTVVQFTGTVPAPPPVVLAFRLNNPSARRPLLTTLRLRMTRYPGRVRIFVPTLRSEGELRNLVRGATLGNDFAAFERWGRIHVEEIERHLREGRFDKEWCQQRIKDVTAALESRVMLTATRPKEVTIANIIMAENEGYTLFLLFEKPQGAQVGSFYPIELHQLEAGQERIIGGLDARLECVPAAQRPPRAAPSGRTRRMTARAVPRRTRRRVASP